MKTFNQYIQEALDKPFEYEKMGQWDGEETQTHHYAFKDHKGVPTHVYFSHHVTSEPDRASVDFTDAQGDFDKTGHGSIRHLSTVKKIMQDHAAKHNHLKKYTFTGSKEDSGGRIKLYTRLTRMHGGNTQDVGHYTKHWIPINRDKNGD